MHESVVEDDNVISKEVLTQWGIWADIWLAMEDMAEFGDWVDVLVERSAGYDQLEKSQNGADRSILDREHAAHSALFIVDLEHPEKAHTSLSFYA